MTQYVLLISENVLKQSTAINMNVDVDFLLPYVRQAQKLYVEPKLGTDLYDKLLADVLAVNLTTDYKKLIDDYIAPMLSNWAFYHCVPFLRFKVENGNIYSKTSETGTALSTEEAQHLREEIRNTAEYYTERLIEYLRYNTSKYPEYGTATDDDIPADKNAYYAGMNLERPRQKGTDITLRNFLTPDISY